VLGGRLCDLIIWRVFFLDSERFEDYYFQVGIGVQVRVERSTYRNLFRRRAIGDERE